MALVSITQPRRGPSNSQLEHLLVRTNDVSRERIIQRNICCRRHMQHCYRGAEREVPVLRIFRLPRSP